MCLKFNNCPSLIRSSRCLRGVEMFCDLFRYIIEEELNEEFNWKHPSEIQAEIQEKIKKIFLSLFQEKLIKEIKNSKSIVYETGATITGFDYKETWYQEMKEKLEKLGVSQKEIKNVEDEAVRIYFAEKHAT